MPDYDSELSRFIQPPGRTIAGCTALAGFSIAILIGLSAGNATQTILERAILSMFGCFLIGSVAGSIFEFVIRHSLIEYFDSHPVPDSGISVDDLVEQKRSRERQEGPNQVMSPDTPVTIEK